MDEQNQSVKLADAERATETETLGAQTIAVAEQTEQVEQVELIEQVKPPLVSKLPNYPLSYFDSEKHIIDDRQKTWKKVLEYILTALGWIYILVYLVYVIYGIIAVRFNLPLLEIGLYNRGMLAETEHMLFILFIGTLLISLYLIIWRQYNFRRFGRKDRRKFPKDVTDGELAERFGLDEEKVKELKTQKVIVFEENVI